MSQSRETLLHLLNHTVLCKRIVIVVFRKHIVEAIQSSRDSDQIWQFASLKQNLRDAPNSILVFALKRLVGLRCRQKFLYRLDDVELCHGCLALHVVAKLDDLSEHQSFFLGDDGHPHLVEINQQGQALRCVFAGWSLALVSCVGYKCHESLEDGSHP